MTQRSRRILVAAAIGVAAAELARGFSIPLDPGWMVVCWGAGAIAGGLVGGIDGFLAAGAGVVASVIGTTLRGGQYPGLAWLVAAAETGMLGHGFILGATVRRAAAVRTIADRWVLAGVLATAGVAALFALIAADLARNPA